MKFPFLGESFRLSDSSEVEVVAWRCLRRREGMKGNRRRYFRCFWMKGDVRINGGGFRGCWRWIDNCGGGFLKKKKKKKTIREIMLFN